MMSKMWFKNILPLAVCGMMFAACEAQTLELKGTFVGENAADMSLYAMPMGNAEAPDLVKLEAEGENFAGTLAVAPEGFYGIYGKYNGAQLSIPLYISHARKAGALEIRMQDGCPWVETGKDNQALSAFNAVTYTKGRYLWTQGQQLDAEGLKAFLKGYGQAADSIADHYKCADPVRRYLKLWAYVTTYNNYTSFPGVRKGGVFPLSDVLEAPEKVLNTPIAAYFPSLSYIVFGTLPKGGLQERLTYLREHYSDESVCKKVEMQVVNDFVTRFEYDSSKYEEGLAELKSVVEKYGLPDECVKKFESRKSSMAGKPFPAEAKLTDAECNVMDFGMFKGYYVYIDLWASWCGPCCREVPFLQQLEKDLQNDQVKFLSISMDKDAKAWKAKMKALNMHGHQWLTEGETLGEALNVRGIPRFLIYDKEGRLYRGNAPRPSDPALKELLESLR